MGTFASYISCSRNTFRILDSPKTWEVLVVHKFTCTQHLSCCFLDYSTGRFLLCGAMIVQYMPSLCACLSVTLQYCIKMAKRRIMQIMPHDSPGTRFLTPKITAKFELHHPLWGQQMQVGWVKIGAC